MVAARHDKAVPQTPTQLKTQLAQAVRAEYGLRKRLTQVGNLARTNLAQLLKQLKNVKVGERKTENQLRSQIQEEKSRLAKEEGSEAQLRSQLAAAQASTMSAREALATQSKAEHEAAAKAAAQSKADHQAMAQLREELKAARKQAAEIELQNQARAQEQAKETASLREQLRKSKQVTEKAQGQSSDQPPKAAEVASVPSQQSAVTPSFESMTNVKPAPQQGSGSTLQMMASFFAKPLHR